MSEEEVFVALESNFDWRRVVVDEFETHAFTKGGSTIEWITSKVYVKGDNDKKLPIYFELAEQNLWGINGIWPIGTLQEDQSLDAIEGFQRAYPLTSLFSVESPTKAERETRDIFDTMWKTTVDALKKFCRVKPSKGMKVPAPTYSSYITVNTANDCIPLYDYSTSSRYGEKFLDYTKPRAELTSSC